MHLIRTHLGSGIISEYSPSTTKSNKVILLYNGAPGYASQQKVMQKFSDFGFHVFLPRLRGSWESGGEFLQYEPDQDCALAIEAISNSSCVSETTVKGYSKTSPVMTNLFTGEQLVIKNPKFYLIGSSFGGAVVLLASKHKQVKKVIALSAVSDWRVDSKLEPMEQFIIFCREGFGEGYRCPLKNWKKLGKTSFFNPMEQLGKIDGEKILMIHGKRDGVVPVSTAIDFAAKTKSQLEIISTDDHFGLRKMLQGKVGKLVIKALS